MPGAFLYVSHLPSFLLASLIALAGALSAQAGGGPENVLLVVNSNSQSSLTIANHYIHLRDIPVSNVVYLDWKHSLEWSSLKEFRKEILEPVLTRIQSRRLKGQIDYIVYSSDFPTRINIESVLDGKKARRELAPTASLTGLTYLFQFVLADDVANRAKLLSLGNNLYAPPPVFWEQVLAKARRRHQIEKEPPKEPLLKTKTQAFHNWYGWAPNAKVMESGGIHYYLSTMLGVTVGQGNSLEEVLAYLRRSAKADHTYPTGTIYYMHSDDVRSKTRRGGFKGAVAELEKLGVGAEIIAGTIPSLKKDVQGAMLGIAKFRWQASQSTIRPGAICDHLTSYGGNLSKSTKQTTLAEFLRNGAAGASGTVTEPLSIQAKFPLPAIHVHYARGCSLAESFYQSVSGPYQLLIVGDPLCQPWGDQIRVRVSGLDPDATIESSVELTPTARTRSRKPVEQFELFVGGRRVDRCRPGGRLTLRLADLLDGWREVRVVAIGRGPIESQGRWIRPVRAKRYGGDAHLRVRNDRSLAADGVIQLDARCDGAKQILIYQNRRRLGVISGDRGALEIPISQTGHGPVTLFAIAQAPHPVFSRPVTVEIP